MCGSSMPHGMLGLWLVHTGDKISPGDNLRHFVANVDETLLTSCDCLKDSV